jgi:PhoPQ-activated pathogenicity-related protein
MTSPSTKNARATLNRRHPANGRFSLIVTLVTTCFLTMICPENQAADPQPLPRRTALDDYIEKPDDSYRWEIHSNETKDGMTTIIVDMVSQTWRTKEDVDRTEWRHWLTLSIPETVESDTAMLFIGGGYNGEGPRSNKRTDAIARATNSVVAMLGMVPNQRLMFHDDGVKRTEDDLIGYTWDQFLKTGDPTWPARNPMVKSAVRAMDTITAVMASEHGGGHQVDRFVVAGGSKRGWTTWLTGAVDDRVVAIIPIVIDVLNSKLSMKHHFAAYGFWAPSVGNYVDHQIMARMDEPRIVDLFKLVDPYSYRHRLTMPKLVLNAAGDQFFLPDSSKFYWDDLRGENYLRYVPNGDHGLDETDAQESIIAFYSLILQNRKPPQFVSTVSDNGTIRVLSHETPQEVRLWQANNPEARDFRVETLGRKYTSTVIEPNSDGLYIAEAPQGNKGWTAYFVEMTYDVGTPAKLKLTTGVQITPDTLPFKDKPHDLPTSVTLVATAPSEDAAQPIVDQVQQLMQMHNLVKGDIRSVIKGQRLFINWVPGGDFREGAGAITKYLKENECSGFAYQLESGSGITLPPGLD